MEKKLTPPTFSKIKALQNSQDGYNVYVKVINVEHTASKNGQFQIARATVGDQTGVADAFFKGENANLIQKGGVIAIRNGRIRLIKNHISLEIDIFGRITKQNKQIQVDPSNNISGKQITRRRTQKPRRDYEKPRRDESGKAVREDKPRREFSDKPKRDFGDKPKRDFGDRPKRDFGDKPKRDFGDRPKRDFGDRPKRDYEDKPKRDYEDKPKRQYNKDSTTNKPRIQWTKIGAIEPGDEEINITARVISVEPVGKKARVVFGDETGIVKGFLFNDECIKQGNTVVIFNAEAAVVKQHIEIQVLKGGKVQQSRNRKIQEVDESVDISEKAWVESA